MNREARRAKKKRQAKAAAQFSSPAELDQHLRRIQRKSHLTTAGVIGGFGLLIAGFIYWIGARPPELAASVHWHLPVSYELCGDTTQLPEAENHGSTHGHNDNIIHLEGTPTKATRLLGNFFGAAEIPFGKTQIGDYKNGDTCPDSETAGTVRLLVNDVENRAFGDYILQEGDQIKIVFR